MRKALMLIVPLLLILSLTSRAQADTTNVEASAWNSTASAERASSVMGVSTAQAAEDLEVQHAAFHTIGELTEAGDNVWFDNQTATVHIYGSVTSVAIPASVASHVVYDTTLHSFPARTTVTTAASCGTSRLTEDYCSPLEGGGKIDHMSGAKSGECSVGFMVRSYSGTPYIITAAHCVTWGTTFYTNSFTSEIWPGLKECEVGSPVSGISAWSGYDAAISPITGCEGVTPYIHNWETGANIHQEGATNTQYVGEYVCHFGVTSLYACGTIVAVNVPSVIKYETGEYAIKETDQVCGYAAPGDSGGPVTDGTYTGDATGITLAVGPEPKCGGTDTLWIEQRIFAVLNLFDVYVASS
jgi:hypothetical protein